jgi:hypothetical protein
VTTPKRPPAFPFYVDAWFSSVSVTTMPPEVEGTYLRLLGYQWRSMALPIEPSAIRLLTKLNEKQWRTAWPLLVKHFPVVENGRRNPTMEALRVEREEYLAKQRTNGKHGGRPRSAEPDEPAPPKPTRTQKKPTENPTVMPEKPTGSVSPNPNETSGSGFGSGLDVPPPAADAAGSPSSASGTQLAEGDTAQRAEALLAHFTEPHHRDAVAGFIRAHRIPDVAITEIDGMRTGLTAPGMVKVPVPIIGQALHEMRVGGITQLNAAQFRGFVQRLQNPGIPRDDGEPDSGYGDVIKQLEREVEEARHAPR